ncbi:hypothetical protein L210DRAFT_3589413, partial [Boletus edulis BED1]
VYGVVDPRATMMGAGGMGMGMHHANGSQTGGFGSGPIGDGPSLNSNPSDEEVFNALRTYLSTQDLMTVTKK